MLEIKKKKFAPKRANPENYRRRRTAKRVIVATVVLLTLLIVGALVYVWYMGKHPAKTALSQPVDTSSVAPKIKVHTPPPDAPVGIVQQTFSGAVKPGNNASISVKTNAKAACQIAVKVGGKTPLSDSGLVPKIADDFGLVDWSWTVPKGVLAGTWPVEITCANESNRSAYFKVNLVIE